MRTHQKSLLLESFGRLLAVAADSIDGFKMDLIITTTNAQLLENELSSTRLEKEMVSEDLSSITFSLNSLRVAFSEMESECIQLRV